MGGQQTKSGQNGDLTSQNLAMLVMIRSSFMYQIVSRLFSKIRNLSMYLSIYQGKQKHFHNYNSQLTTINFVFKDVMTGGHIVGSGFLCLRYGDLFLG